MQQLLRRRIAQTFAALMIFSLVVVALGAVSAANAATPTVSAETPPQFGIFPVGNYPNGYFDLTLKPGETGNFTAGVANIGKVDASLRAFAANASNPPNGGFAAGSETDKATPPTTWLQFPATSFDLAPGAKRELSFTITVPTGTAPGQYVTALVVRTANSLPIPGTSVLKQIIRSAVSIEITVPGPVKPGFTLGKPAFNTTTAISTLDVPIQNTGNIVVKPEGTLTVTTAAGALVIRAPIQMGSVYAGLSTTIEISLPAQMQSGSYVVSVNLTDPKTGATAAIDKAPISLAATNAAPPTFAVNPVSVKANGSPVQFAAVSATITNNGPTIPTARVTLDVKRNGQPVEDYVLAQNQALASGKSTISQRYIPAGGWKPGTYTFQLVVVAVNGTTETILATVDVADTVVVK